MMADTYLSACTGLAELSAGLDGLQAIDEAPARAVHLRQALRRVVGVLSGEVASRLISNCNERLSKRVVELTAARHRLPATDWCWLALGSEGRHEQTFLSDQDNGLVFSALDAREADAMRGVFLDFAQEVNQRLADCGFPLCRGQVMAGNPAWCLSLDEWRACFTRWVRLPEPEALLNASIFFDLRPVHGTPELGENLRTLLLSLTTATPAFLHLMGANALQAPAPISFRGKLLTDDEQMLDLKKFGSRIFVDAARIFALAAGSRAVHTGERLREAGAAAGMPDDEIAAVDAAFSQVLRLRIESQIDCATVGEAGNLVKPDAFNEIDRSILREALKQARRLQQRIKLNYAL